MFRRYLAALILVVALAAASTNKSVDARVVHPIVTPDDDPGAAAAGPSPAAAAGRRLIGTTVGHDELVALCQQMHYKTLCTTMTTLPGVTTPEQLLDASLRITAVKAGMAETKLDEAMKSSGGGNPMASCLETCKESYASVVDSINTSRDTLKSGGSNADLMSELSAAATYSTDCDEAFEERPELTSPIPGAQRHIGRLVSNCLDLAATIREQP